MRKSFATSLEEAIIKELKLFAVEKDQNYNQIIENALSLYFAIAKDKGWNEIISLIPYESFKVAKIKEFCDSNTEQKEQRKEVK